MYRPVIQLPGERLTLNAYLADFGERFWNTDESGCWKIERQQEFIEPGDASWEAFAKGDWTGALRLIEARRQELTRYHLRARESGFEIRRVRVVQEPFSPYLLWELNALRVRAQSGGKIRVVDVSGVEPFEEDGMLPEIFVLGRSTAYQVLYGEDGAAEGAVRTTDAAVVERWRGVAERLYAAGEDIASYYQRRVAGRRPPDLTDTG